MCDNGFTSDKEFERLVLENKVRITLNKRIKMTIEQELKHLYLELESLRQFLNDTDKLRAASSYLLKAHKLDGYLEDLIADTEYSIEIVEEEISRLDHTVVS